MRDELCRVGRASTQDGKVEGNGLESLEEVAQIGDRIDTEVPHATGTLRDERRDTGAQGCRYDGSRGEMHMRIDCPRGCDQPFARDDPGRVADQDFDIVHDVRVTGATDRDDATVLDPDTAFEDAENRIHHDDVRDNEVQLAGAVIATGEHPIANRTPEADERFESG
ncbi:hypothetical protein HRbin27_01413 [bacterium HR27]|nr:hypothetical protein HRbin27_01413 [bacterium HR27]